MGDRGNCAPARNGLTASWKTVGAVVALIGLVGAGAVDWTTYRERLAGVEDRQIETNERLQGLETEVREMRLLLTRLSVHAGMNSAKRRSHDDE